MKMSTIFHVKRITALFLVFSLLFNLCVFNSYAEDLEEDEQFTLDIEEAEKKDEEESLEEVKEEDLQIVDENEQYYLKGNDEYLKLEAFDVQERLPGSFYMEAETGVVPGGVMRVVEDADASEGKGIASDASLRRYVPEEIPNVDARFRINVTEKGLYTVFLRMKTPASGQKATYVAFDNDQWRRAEYSTTFGDYTWFTTNASGIGNPNYARASSAYLDKGVHVLNLMARNGGHIIDCIVVTKNSWRPKGYGSLPGEPYRYTAEELEVIEYENSRSKLTIDNFNYLPDVEFKKNGGDIIVPALNILNMMGIEVKVRDDYYLASYDRDYLKIYINSDRAVANGKEIRLSTKTYLYEDNILMVPISAMEKVFDFSYTYDETNNTLHITTHFKTDKNIRCEQNSIIETQPYTYGCKYNLKIDRPNATVKVWLKRRLASFYRDEKMSYTKDAFNGGWKGYTASKIDYYWGEVFTPKYEDGVFKGDAGYLYRNAIYDMKVSVVDGEYKDVFIIPNAIHTNTPNGETPLGTEHELDRAKVEDEDWIITNGELITIPTFENISCYIDESDNETSCEIYFREKGAQEWRKAYKPIFDERVTGGQYRGSIVYLNEDTLYEVKANILKEGKIVKTATSECKTWSSNVPVSKTINITDIYEPDKYDPLVLSGIKGSEDGWIKIVGDGKTIIDAGYDWLQSVYLTDCEYIILEGLTIKGGSVFGINLANDCENIRIVNCDVSEWGENAVLNPWLSMYIIGGGSRNLSAGIRIHQCKNIVVERCYIHDTLGCTNSWELEGYWTKKHPAGTTGISLGGTQGLVIRWNDISGSDTHRFNDVVECASNNANHYGPGFDSDMYGNLFYCSEDDAVEIDSSGRNVRFYENRLEQTFCGLSTAPTNMGPLYVYRNLIVNMGSSQQDFGENGIKVNDGLGMQFIFNNTMSSNIRGSGSWPHGMSRNNITTGTRNGGGGADEIADYDIVTGKVSVPSEEFEPHGYFEQPEYVNAEIGDYRLKSGSTGVDEGQTLDNFSDVAVGNTDIGAYEENGRYSLFPYRPLNAEADKYFVKIDNHKEMTVTFTLGEIDESLDYGIHTNLQNEFLSIEGVNCELSGKVKANTTYTVKIKADLSDHYMWIYNEKIPFKEGNGMLYFRLSNGLSVPVTIYVER